MLSEGCLYVLCEVSRWCLRVQVRTGQVRTGQVKSGRVRVGQVIKIKSKQIMLGLFESGGVMSGQI